MSLYEDAKSAIDTVISEYKKVVTDGKISVSEVFTLVGKATATFVNLFRSLNIGTESERKETVVLAVAKFYDEIVAPIDITGVPNFLEPVVDRALRELLLLLTRSWSDAVLAVFTKSEIVVQQRANMTLSADCDKETGCDCPQGVCFKQVTSQVDTHEVQRIVEDARSAVVIY